MQRTLSIVACLSSCTLLSAFEMSDIDIHGFVSQGYLNSSDNNWGANTDKGTFEFNEAAINFSLDLNDDLRAGLQLFAFDLGPIGNNEVTIDWGYLDYNLRQEFGFRAGRVKMIAGLYNEYQDIDAVRPTVLLPQSVYYTLKFREASLAVNGAQVYGNIPLATNSWGDLDYQATVGTPSFGLNSSIAREFANFNQLDSLNSEYAIQAGLFWNTPLEGLKVGISGYNLFNTTASGSIQEAGIPIPLDVSLTIDHYAVWIASLEYTWQDLTLAAEYRGIDYTDVTNVDVPIDTDSDGIPDDLTTITEHRPTREAGWYLQASYVFNEAYTSSIYYSYFDADRNGHNGLDSSDPARVMHDIALALRWDINDYWNAKIEGHYIDGYALLRETDNPGGFEDQWWLLALKTTLSF